MSKGAKETKETMEHLSIDQLITLVKAVMGRNELTEVEKMGVKIQIAESLDIKNDGSLYDRLKSSASYTVGNVCKVLGLNTVKVFEYLREIGWVSGLEPTRVSIREGYTRRGKKVRVGDTGKRYRQTELTEKGVAFLYNLVANDSEDIADLDTIIQCLKMGV